MHKPAETGVALTIVNNQVQDFAEHIRTNRPGGVDLATPIGTKLYACESGYMENRIDQYGGKYVAIWVENRLWLYVHLSEFSRENGTVSEGELIGLAGSSGWSTGAHTHWELRVDGVRKDPIIYYQSQIGDPDLYHLMSVFRTDVAKATTPQNVYESWWLPFGHKELLYHLGVVGRFDVVSTLGTTAKELRDWYVDNGYKEIPDIWLKRAPAYFHSKL